MGKKVGNVELELLLQSNSFKKQLDNAVSSAVKGIEGKVNKLSGTVGKIGKIIGGAFAVKKVVEFGKECISLGSDLTEVQNVVDVTFGKMADNINDFAKDAMEAYGLSETVAKQYAGRYGAMAKTLGFSNQAAVNMSKTLTALAGDVASFYNIQSDEAFVKLSGIFTGETEALKGLGIVMTQNVLDQYALANGYGKTTSKMTEQEKVAVRYKYVLEQLSSANNDFSRTSDTWANQTRVLKLRFDALKASIGQGLAYALTPVVKMLNLILAKLQIVADAFRNLIAKITGNKIDTSGANDVATGMQTAENATANTDKNLNKATKKAKKLKSLMSIDELNVLTPKTETAKTTSPSAGDIAFSGIPQKVAEKANKTLDKLKNKVKELFDEFKKGFKAGLGKDFEASLERMKKHIKSIGKSLQEIFLDKKVVAAADTCAKKIAYALGQVSGSVVSIGMTIAENLLGGIDKYLQQSKDFIKKRIVGILDATGDIFKLAGNLAQAVAEIFEVFRSDAAKQCTADLIAIFANTALGIAELGLKIGRDLLNCIVQPIVQNRDKIKLAIENTLKPISEILHSISDFVKKTLDGILGTYDTKITSFLQGVADALTAILGVMLDGYNNIIAPILGDLIKIGGTLFGVWKGIEFLSFLQQMGGIAGAVATAKSAIDTLKLAFIELTVKKAEDIAETIILNAMYAKEFVVSIGQAVIALAKEGIAIATATAKKVAYIAVQATMTLAIGTYNAVCAIATTVTKGFSLAIAGLTSPIGIAVIAIGTIIAAGVMLYKHWNEVKAKLKELCDALSKSWNEAKESLKSITNKIGSDFSNGWSKIKSSVVGTVNNSIKPNVTNAFKLIHSSISTSMNGIKNSVFGTFNSIKNTLKGIINGILGGIEKMVNGIVKGINSMANALNSLQIDVPDGIPGIGGKSIGFNIPKISSVSIPRLANGGYVQANTPQLAMIGDNKHEGEIVAPESKISEAVSNGMNAVIEKLIELLGGNDSGSEQPINIYLGNELLDSLIVNSNNRRALRSGGRG